LRSRLDACIKGPFSEGGPAGQADARLTRNAILEVGQNRRGHSKGRQPPEGRAPQGVGTRKSKLTRGQAVTRVLDIIRLQLEASSIDNTGM